MFLHEDVELAGKAAMLFSRGSGALYCYSLEPICGPVVTFLLHARLLSKILSKTFIN